MTTKAIYPGTFDPITYGHLDLVQRASLIFDNVILAVNSNSNSGKSTLFTASERITLAEEVTRHLKNVQVAGFNELTVHFASKHNATILLRGLRSTADFTHERQLASMNRHLMPALESVFMIASEKWSFISSSLVKEVARYGGDISELLPAPVLAALLKKLN